MRLNCSTATSNCSSVSGKVIWAMWARPLMIRNLKCGFASGFLPTGGSFRGARRTRKDAGFEHRFLIGVQIFVQRELAIGQQVGILLRWARQAERVGDDI